MERIKKGDWSNTKLSLKKAYSQKVEPLGLFKIDEDFKYLIIDYNTDDLSELISTLDDTFIQVFPEAPFHYFFLDEDFNRQYASEEKIKVLFTSLTLLGLLIACIGLLGLASFMTQQRTREIGIRKVNGAP